MVVAIAMFYEPDASDVLAAILNNVAYITVTATHLRLGATAPPPRPP